MESILKIDEINIGQHSHLRLDKDECYYFVEYTARKGFSYSDANQLIINLKKEVSQKGTYSWPHKLRAIRTCANMLLDNVIEPFFDIDTATIVPMPSSKTKAHPEYDDRMLQVTKEAFKGYDVRDCIQPIESRRSSHTSDVRPSIEELYNNLVLDRELCTGIGKTVILVDDMVTTGALFRACRRLILEQFPDTKIIGIFIARRNLENPFLDFVDEEL